jgi:hypothetical protein
MTRTTPISCAGRFVRRHVLTALVPVTVLLSTVSGAADLEPLSNKPSYGEILSFSAKTMPSTTKELVTIPPGRSFMLTTVCVEHGAMTVDAGTADEPLAFRTPGCTSFRPGFVVASGNTVRCINSSGSTHSCSVVGVMRDESATRTRRAVFIDVDAAIKAAEEASRATIID